MHLVVAKEDAFHAPSEWNTIGTGIGTLKPTMSTWMRKFARGTFVARKDGGTVVELVRVDGVGGSSYDLARATGTPARRSHPCRSS
ncbi:hypothetical protein [Bradyrhizobium sp. BR 1433]|uniref:hypothetical protein n=1 Tax=Bradyrhizobium sp. BR 1433 TaxID=3447967 RepID=UPI003EE7E960